MKNVAQFQVLKTLKRNSTFGILAVYFLFYLNSFGQKIESSLTETWTNNNWENFSKVLNTYDFNTYMTNSLSQLWDVPSSSWNDRTQTIYNNNPNGTVNQAISQTWNIALSAWENTQRTTYTYNINDKDVGEITERWVSGAWENFNKQINMYDSNGYLTTILFQNWDIPTVSWVNDMQSLFSNDVSGAVLQIVMQSWDTVSTTWGNMDRITYTYNASNKPITTLDEIWVVSAWQNFFKQTYSYDTSDYLINTVSQLWDVPTTLWVNYVQFNYTNNPDGSVFQVVSQLWDDPTTTWVNSQRTTYTYLVLGVSDFAVLNKFTVYPNPVNESINVKLAANTTGLNYSISDQIGREILTGKLNPNETNIDSNQLAQGIYFIKIDQFNNQVVKFIKR